MNFKLAAFMANLCLLELAACNWSTTAEVKAPRASKPQNKAEVDSALIGEWKIDQDFGLVPGCTTTVVLDSSGRFLFPQIPALALGDGTYPFGVCAINYGGSFTTDSTLSGSQSPLFHISAKIDTGIQCVGSPHVNIECRKAATGEQFQYELIFHDYDHIEFYSHSNMPPVFFPNRLKRIR
jgi:hypothetical protein